MSKLNRLIPCFVLFVALCAGVACSSKAKLERSLARADRYFDNGEFPKAEIEYMNVLQLSGMNAKAIGRLGAIYFEQGRVGRAYGFLSRASEMSTNDIDLRSKLAAVSLTVGNFGEARTNANLVLDQDPKHPEAPLLLAESATTPKERQAVRDRLEKIAATIGETAPVQLAFGVLQLRDGDMKSGEASIKRALQLDPKLSAAHLAMGGLYLSKNDLKNAEPEFKAAAELAPQRSPRRLAYADFKIRTGELEEGKRLLEEISKEVPDYLPPWLRRAEIALAEKDYKECESFLNQVISRDGENLEALLLRGRLLLAQGEAAKAVADLERTSRQFQDKVPQAHYFLAQAHLQNNDPAKALRSVNQSLAINTNSVDALLLQARLNIARGEPAAAVAAVAPIVKQQPQNAQAHLLLADGYLAQKRPEDAAAVFRQMRKEFPKDSQVPFLLGSVLLQQNKSAEARTAFEESRSLAPEFLPALERLVDLDMFEKKPAAALNRVQQHMEKYPKAAGPWLILAKIHSSEKKLDEAESALKKAIELDPSQRMAYLLLSQIYLSSNRQKDALQQLNTLVAKQTNDVAALMQIGMIHDQMKNAPAARDAYEKLLAVDPSAGPALNNLAYLYSEYLDDLDKAYKYAERARQAAPNDPSVADTFGWILYKRGDYSRALALLRESASKLVTEPEIQFHLGMTHYMLGNLELARVALERAVESEKQFPGKDGAAARLAILNLNPEGADPSVLQKLEKALQDDPADPVVPGKIAVVYERTGALDKAVQSYETALKRNPKNIPAMRGLLRIYTTKRNDPKKALELAKTAYGLAPQDGEIAHALGRLYYQSGDYKRALVHLQEVERLLPGNSGVHFDLALALYQNSQVEEAEKQMKQALQVGNLSKPDQAKQFVSFVGAKTSSQAQALSSVANETLKADSKYLPALMVVALAQEATDVNKARDTYEQVLAANPSFTPAIRNVTLLNARTPSNDTKRYDLALKARSAYPADPEVARAVGIIAYAKGDYSRAVSLLKESSRHSPTDATSLYYLGLAHYQQKDRAASKSSLGQAIKLNLPDQFAADAKKKLAELQ